jgi:hypothetical protein
MSRVRYAYSGGADHLLTSGSVLDIREIVWLAAAIALSRYVELATEPLHGGVCAEVRRVQTGPVPFHRTRICTSRGKKKCSAG